MPAISSASRFLRSFSADRFPPGPGPQLLPRRLPSGSYQPTYQPQCYLQAYLAQTLFEALPLPAILAGALVAGAIVVWITLRRTPKTG